MDEIPGLEWKNEAQPKPSKADATAQAIEQILTITPLLDEAYDEAGEQKQKTLQSRQKSPKEGTEDEMRELIELFNNTQDEEMKQFLKNQIFSLSTGTEGDTPAEVKTNK